MELIKRADDESADYAISAAPDVAPTIPGMAAFAQTESLGDLVFVRHNLRELLLRALSLTRFVKDPSSTAQVATGTAVMAAPGAGEKWVARFVASGNAVLVNRASTFAGQPSFAITEVPQEVRRLASVGGGWAIVNAPAGLVALAQPIEQQVPGMCPPPLVETPNGCQVPGAPLSDDKVGYARIASEAFAGALAAGVAGLVIAWAVSKRSNN